MAPTGKPLSREELAKARKRASQELLKSAENIVAAVDRSDFSQQTKRRDFPVFERNEIVAGPLLGVGGFCVVFEVEQIVLHDVDGGESGSGAASTAQQKVDEQTAQHTQEEEERDKKLENQHYNVDQARTLMVAIQRRHGTDARFAIKRLRKELPEYERARGIIDLAIETNVLARLWHPNIIKMRGYSAGSRLDLRSFIVMDRLYETLDQKISIWSKDLHDLHSLLMRAGAFKLFSWGGNEAAKKHREEADRDILLQRMIVLYDLASAFSYMHQNRLVYRDIKQDNIGFDVRGDVKVFDFGLAKGLSESLRAKSTAGRPLYGYYLTARSGSIPYMAPEVALKMPYDCKCDVFSFSILCWEVLALKTAFRDCTKADFLRRVVEQKERPSVPQHSPPLTRLMLKEAWAHDPEKRPDMKRVATMIRGDLNDLSTDASVQERTTHMRDRSSHSQRLQRIELMRQQMQRHERTSGREIEF